MLFTFFKMPRATRNAQEYLKIKQKEKANTQIENSENEENDVNIGSVPDGYDENEDLLNMEIPPLHALLMNADGSGQRLMISRLEVENFKSYYGKQIIGPFHKVLKINCIFF